MPEHGNSKISQLIPTTTRNTRYRRLERKLANLFIMDICNQIVLLFLTFRASACQDLTKKLRLKIRPETLFVSGTAMRQTEQT